MTDVPGSGLMRYAAICLLVVVVTTAPVVATVPVADGVSSVSAASDGTFLVDGFDDGSLNEWNVVTSGDASATETDGVLRMRVFKCNSVTVTRTFTGSGPTRVAFDWSTYVNDAYWEKPGWALYDAETGEEIDYTVVSGEDVRGVGDPGGRRSSSLVVEADLDGRTTIEFELRPSNFCDNFDHADTFFEVDDLGVTAVDDGESAPSPPEPVLAPDLEVVDRSLNRSTARIGDPVEVSVTVANEGERAGRYEAPIRTIQTGLLGRLGGDVPPGERRTFSTTVQFDAVDSYLIQVGGFATSEVEVQPRGQSTWLELNNAYLTRDTVRPGDSYTVVATVENTAPGFRTPTVAFASSDGESVLRSRRLAPGEQAEIRLTRTVPEDATPGRLSWRVQGETAGSLQVEKPDPSPPGESAPGEPGDESPEETVEVVGGFTPNETVPVGGSYEVVGIVRNDFGESREVMIPFTRVGEAGSVDTRLRVAEVPPGVSRVTVDAQAPGRPGLVRWGVGADDVSTDPITISGAGPDDGEGPERADGSEVPAGDPTAAYEIDATETSYGESVTGGASIAGVVSGNADRYNGLYDTVTFQAEPGDALRLTLNERVQEGGTAQDLAVTVLGPDGRVVAERTDDGGRQTLLRLEKARLYQGGTHTVVVWSERDSLGFAYSLTIQNVASDADGDGLTGFRETKGVPISSPAVQEIQTHDTGRDDPTRLTTLGGASDPNAVQIDPDKRDTDGDGLADSEEIGQFHAVGQVETAVEGVLGKELEVVDVGDRNGFYTLDSDPSDKYSDGVGFDDGTEHERGSDPFEKEQFVAAFTVPTINEGAEQPDPKTFDVGTHEQGGYKVFPALSATPEGDIGLNTLEEAPRFVRLAYTETGTEYNADPDTHIVVDVPVYFSQKGASEDDLPKTVDFELVGGAAGADAEVVAVGYRGANDPTGGDGDYFLDAPVRGNTQVVSVVIDTNTQRNTVGDEYNLGRLRMTATFPTDSIYIRSSDDPSDRTISITSDRPYVVGSTLAQETDAIGDGAASLLTSTAINSLFLSVGPNFGHYAQGAAALGSTGGTIGFLGLEAANTVGTAGGDEVTFNRVRESPDTELDIEQLAARPQAVRIRDFVANQVETRSKADILNNELGDARVTRTGAVLIRYV